MWGKAVIHWKLTGLSKSLGNSHSIDEFTSREHRVREAYFFQQLSWYWWLVTIVIYIIGIPIQNSSSTSHCSTAFNMLHKGKMFGHQSWSFPCQPPLTSQKTTFSFPHLPTYFTFTQKATRILVETEAKYYCSFVCRDGKEVRSCRWESEVGNYLINQIWKWKIFQLTFHSDSQKKIEGSCSSFSWHPVHV